MLFKYVSVYCQELKITEYYEYKTDKQGETSNYTGSTFRVKHSVVLLHRPQQFCVGHFRGSIMLGQTKGSPDINISLKDQPVREFYLNTDKQTFVNFDLL